MNEAKQVVRRFLALFLVLAMILPLLPQLSIKVQAAVSGELSGLSNEDIRASYSGSDDGSYTSWAVTGGNGITGTAKSKDGGGCGSDAKCNTTLTLTNNKDTAAILSFDYKLTLSSGTVQVAGVTAAADGSYSGTLEPGASIKIYLESGDTNNDTKIEISSLSLISDVQASTTFLPSENGSYTVDGEEITEEIVKTRQSTDAYNLSASAADGYKFFGWYSVTGEKYLSNDSDTSLFLDSDQTITAVFLSEDTPVFDAGGVRFTDLNEADSYALEHKITKIVLVSDGTLTEGEYTISDGITLLIPFDDANTCYTTAPATTGNAYTKPSCYRKLTMDGGANLTVNGALSVSAMHTARGNGFNGNEGGGAPSGKYGYIFMDEGSSITVSNGGGLYVYGYISGDGTVTAQSGSEVYENMQVKDFRGGSVTLAMAGNEQKVFPLNQYFIQNIEAELILESGADEYIYTSLYASSMSTSTAVHFIGEGGMFTVEEGGYFSKKYLPDKDVLEVNVDGDASVNSLTLKVSIASVSSDDYVLPITNGMKLNVLSGTTSITQDVALLAGVEVSVNDGAALKVNNGSSLYIYDRDEWTKNNYASSSKFKTATYSPTRTYTRTDADLTDVRMDINGTLAADGYVYTTAGGADIFSSGGTGKVVMTGGAGTETVTYQAYGTGPTYDALPVTSAKLHNGTQYAGTEEEYTATDSAAAGSVYCYDAAENKWKKEGGAETYTVTWVNDDGSVLETDEDVVYGAMPEYNGATPEKEADEAFSYEFVGWDPQISSVAGDITYRAVYKSVPLIWHIVSFDANGGEGVMDCQKIAQGIDTRLNKNSFTRENYEFTGWNTAADGTGTAYADEAALINLTEDITLYAQWRILNGLWNSGEDTYWVQNGEIVEDAGLIRIVLENGEVNYYYFGADGKAYKGTEGKTEYLVEKNNGLSLPAGISYSFGPDGVIKHFEDTSINGIYYDADSVNYYYCIDGIIVANGLIEINGSYYYARTSTGALVTDRSYWITKTNGLLEEGIYTFDETGRIVFPEEGEKKDGIIEENGSLYYYVDGVLTGAGLIRIDGDYYYVKTSTGEVVHGRSYWITATNGLLPSEEYIFADDGKLVDPPDPDQSGIEEKNGIVKENGSLYYYVDGVLTGAGLIEIDGNYYYVRTSTGEVVHGRTYWITATNGLPVPASQYEFADDGRLILE